MQAKGSTCSVCARSKPAVVYCVDCGDLLCALHCEAHRETKKTEEHKVIELGVFDPLLRAEQKSLNKLLQERKGAIESQAQGANQSIEQAFAALLRCIDVRKSILLNRVQDKQRQSIEKLNSQEKLSRELRPMESGSGLQSRLKDLFDNKRPLVDLVHDSQEHSDSIQNLEIDLKELDTLIIQISQFGNHGRHDAVQPRLQAQPPSLQPSQPLSRKSFLKFLYKFGSMGSNLGQLMAPRGIALAPDGRVVVSDVGNHRIQVFSSEGQPLKCFGSKGFEDGQLLGCRCLDVGVAHEGKEGSFIFAADHSNHRIQVFDFEGNPLWKFGSVGIESGELSYPYSVAVSKRGERIYVAEQGNQRVQVFNSEGSFLRRWPIKDGVQLTLTLMAPEGGGDDEKVIVADQANHNVLIYAADGQLLKKIGSMGSGKGQMMHPSGVAVAPGGYLIVADRNNHRLQLFSPDGSFLESFDGKDEDGEGGLKHPYDVKCDLLHGRVFAVDHGNHCIQVFQLIY